MITIITCWYNEEFLANLFLRHYSFADEIIILLDESNDDNTRRVVCKFINGFTNAPEVTVKRLNMPNGLNDKLKQEQINSEYKAVTDGWVIIADADEFIYIPEGGLHKFLSITSDVVKVDYLQMYQHETETVFNSEQPVFEQRRYGKRNGLERWRKPAVARAGKNFSWMVGHHHINAKPYQFHNEMLLGAHLSMADVDLAIKRRIYGHRNRQSEENYKAKLSVHNWKITEQKIREICFENKTCNRVF